MEIFEYLERATSRIRLNARAREVRAELRAHLLFLAEEREAQGMQREEALAAAMQQLGDSRDLAAALAQAQLGIWPAGPLQAAVGAAILAAGFGSLLYPPLLLLALCGMATYALIRSASPVREAVSSAARLWQHRWPLAALFALAGFYIGAEPVWAAGSYSPWPFEPVFWLALGPALAIACLGAFVWDLRREPSGSGAAVGVATVTFGIAAVALGVLLWRLYPLAPSPFVDWFTSSAAPAVNPVPLYDQNVLYHPAIFTALCLLATSALGAVASVYQRRPASLPVRD